MNTATMGIPVSALSEDARAAFITRTYVHLFGAIGAFTLIEVGLFSSGLARPIAQAMVSIPWLAILGAFMVVSWFASRLAHSAESVLAQYAALGGFVLAQALIFVPMLFIAERMAGGVIESAAITTLLGFGALTAVALITRKDFSFLRSVLVWGFVVALVGIVASVIFGFQMGTWFSVAMVALAGCAILYDTSNILHHYPEDRHVGAALQLFASVAMMFWYVLRLFMSSDD
ncbi:MAG TPA: permease [Lentisphaeria bacterium]|jgi:FtsH-binding integral membrane protein|nr:permease [Lentisphaeria bacterium]